MFFLRHQKSILLLVLYGLMSGLGSAAYAQASNNDKEIVIQQHFHFKDPAYHLNKSG